jgi:hypothetical protein
MSMNLRRRACPGATLIEQSFHAAISTEPVVDDIDST